MELCRLQDVISLNGITLTTLQNEPQIVLKCNVCAQGDYILVTQTEIETIPEPIIPPSTETELTRESVLAKLTTLGLTEEEIATLSV